MLYRKLDLILAKRFAATLGSELALATSEEEVVFNAGLVGIPVFTDARHAQERVWGEKLQKSIEHKPRTHLPGLDSLRKTIRKETQGRSENPIVRILCLGVSLLALVILTIYLLPGARVTLLSREEVQSIKLSLIADPSATTMNISSGSLPTYDQEVTVEGADVIKATGTMTIPDERATGMLKLTNNSKEEITLPARIVVTTIGSDKVRFKISLPNDIVLKPSMTVLLEAQAIKPGTSGNLPADSLVAIEGEHGIELAVTNPEATGGGLDASVPTPTVKDLQTLREHLMARLLQEAQTKLQSRLPANDILIPPTVSIIEAVEETYEPAFGEPAEQVELLLRLKIKALVVSGEMVRDMAMLILDAGIPIGYTPVGHSLMFAQLTSPALGTDGKAAWTMNVSRKIIADIPTDQAIESIKGATTAEATERLSRSLPLGEPAKIVLTPTWWPRMPLLAMRISLVLSDLQ